MKGLVGLIRSVCSCFFRWLLPSGRKGLMHFPMLPSFFYHFILLYIIYIYIYIVYYIYRLHGNMERRQCIPTEGTNVKANVLRRPVNWLIFLTRSHSPNYISTVVQKSTRVAFLAMKSLYPCPVAALAVSVMMKSPAWHPSEKRQVSLKKSVVWNIVSSTIWIHLRYVIYIYIYSMNCLFTRIYFRQKLRKASWKRQPQSNQISLGFLCGDLCQSSILHLVVLLGQKRSRWTTVKQWEASWDSYTSHRWKVSFFLYIYK